MRAAWESTSASLHAATVGIPSVLAARIIRTAISPRVAMNNLSMACVMIAPSLVVECCDDLTRLHRITVFYVKGTEATGRPGGQFGKLLHDLDQANHRVGADVGADLDEVRRVRGGFAVEGPRQWGDDSVFGHVCSSWNSCRKAGKK